MVLWVGVDDTDSLGGMCTTFLATEIIRVLAADHDLVGYPRLVRLNPSIPWKTRGNGAIALRFGRGRGRSRMIGRIGGRSVRSYPTGARSEEDPESVREALSGIMERWAVVTDPTTNPAFVVLWEPPDPALYWHAVRGIVTRLEAREAIAGRGYARTYKNGRGIIGAAAALSWRPRDRTYEVLAYRHPALWGLPREIDASSVREMDAAFPSTFNNYDYANERVVIAPHSPCPILLGIRGDEPRDLPKALGRIRGERADRWIIFETNQGTDDHILRDDWSLRPFTSTSLQGAVTSTPVTHLGGHVVFELMGRRRLDVAAYEPSKQFRNTVRALRPGDRIRVYGSIRSRPVGLNLEKLQVLSLAEDTQKLANPRCPVCGKSMKSMGSRAGYRCPLRHTRVPSEAAPLAHLPRMVAVGFYEPPVCARRHLSKPLKRIQGALVRSGTQSSPMPSAIGALAPRRRLLSPPA